MIAIIITISIVAVSIAWITIDHRRASHTQFVSEPTRIYIATGRQARRQAIVDWSPLVREPMEREHHETTT